MAHDFFQKSWCKFAFDPALASWVTAALPLARAAVTDPENEQWFRCGGTWFVGVNALDNDAQARLPDGTELTGSAVGFIRDELKLTGFSWDKGQVSVCYEGYPKPYAAESAQAFRYRRDRDAAHVDGLHGVGPERRRYLYERHAFILGIPMVEFDADASPAVVWEGSHQIIRATFEKLFASTNPDVWDQLDVTDAYKTARREIFETCPRVAVTARPGEAYLIHRLALHGVAPWQNGAQAGPDGRMICYFRPEIARKSDWLQAA